MKIASKQSSGNVAAYNSRIKTVLDASEQANAKLDAIQSFLSLELQKLNRLEAAAHANNLETQKNVDKVFDQILVQKEIMLDGQHDMASSVLLVKQEQSHKFQDVDAQLKELESKINVKFQNVDFAAKERQLECLEQFDKIEQANLNLKMLQKASIEQLNQRLSALELKAMFYGRRWVLMYAGVTILHLGLGAAILWLM
jgi:CRISPR/Cas system-associated endonuclease/helicase Cas3